MFKTLRTVAALILGILFTVVCGLTGAFLGVVFKIPCVILGRRNPIRYVINLWAYLVTEVCVRRLLSIETVITNTVGPIADDEVVVCIGNHPSTLGVATFTRFVHEYLSSDILTVAKREHLWNPFIGWPLWSLDSAIFVNRSSSKESNESIDSGMGNYLRVPSAVVIFPDMHRPSQELIAKDREDFKGKIPGLESWPKKTLIPRGGGSYGIIQGVKDRRARAVNVTIYCDHTDDSVWKLFNLFGAKFYITAKEDFEVLSLDRDGLNRHFNAEWKRKNKKINRGTIE